MFPVKSKGDGDKKRLLQAYAALNDEGQRSLVDYAEFLVGRSPKDEAIDTIPVLIPRPEEESVVAAIKRLSSSYPMIDRSKMLHETAGLMSQHLLQGRDAAEVIDEMQQLFDDHYQKQFGDGR